MDFRIRWGKRNDCIQVLELIKELAIFEKAETEVELSLAELEEDGFGEKPRYQLIVAEQEAQIIGIALFYEKYSTWKGRCIYLEDLIVTRSKRKLGVGKSLFQAVMMEAKSRNSGRMEWQVLDWNEAAIGFYKNYEAELDGEWINGKFRREHLQKIEFNEGI